MQYEQVQGSDWGRTALYVAKSILVIVTGEASRPDTLNAEKFMGAQSMTAALNTYAFQYLI